MDYKKYEFDEVRLEKRKKLLEMGVIVYPYSFDATHKSYAILQEFVELEKNEKPTDFKVKLSGRVWSQRKMGKSFFIDLKDETAKIQIYLTKDNFEDIVWEQINLLDIGDIIGVSGSMFRTKMGEISIKVSEFTFLSKVVISIPVGKEVKDEQTGEVKVYYQLSDDEAKYRERYLHWLLNEEDRNRIVKRGLIISEIRNWMEKEGFLEVSTPSVEFVYGGAEARPFKTNIWALGNKEAFLRISPELYLKRYIVAGFPKVFTICQNFRNEGIDYSHNPEFTMMEWYEAYTDYEFQMQRFENLVSTVCQKICGTTKVMFKDMEIDFKTPWRRLKMLDALKEYENIDASIMSVQELKVEMEKREIETTDDITWGLAVVELFEATCEEHLINPTFVIDHPVDISPMTKIKRGDNRLVERFEPFACKMEIGNAYSELTDPVTQLERFLEQKEMQAKRPNKEKDKDYSDNPLDTDFIKAIGCGMAPTGGVGLGIDRVIMLLTNSSSIRDITPFPMVSPKI